MTQPEAQLPTLFNAGDLVVVKGNSAFTAALLKRLPQLIGMRGHAKDDVRLLGWHVEEAQKSGANLLLHFDRTGRYFPYWCRRAVLALEAKSATRADIIRLCGHDCFGRELRINGDKVEVVEAGE